MHTHSPIGILIDEPPWLCDQGGGMCIFGSAEVTMSVVTLSSNSAVCYIQDIHVYNCCHTHHAIVTLHQPNHTTSERCLTMHTHSPIGIFVDERPRLFDRSMARLGPLAPDGRRRAHA